MSLTKSPGDSGFNYMVPQDGGSEFARVAFQSKRLMAQIRTMLPVRVVKVYKQDGMTEGKRGEVAGAGFIDAQPVVSQVDGKNQRLDHVTLYHIPYTRIYGGDAAIIMDPVKGDIGYIKVSDRDISAFKDQIRQGSDKLVLPGSRRRHDMSDSLYVGGVLNNTPSRYITFSDNGITIKDKSGASIVWDSSGNIQVIPASGKTVFLGGTGSDGGYAFVSTASGPSINVKARIS